MYRPISNILKRVSLSLKTSFSTIPPYIKHCKPYVEDSSNFISKIKLERDIDDIKTIRLMDLEGNLLINKTDLVDKETLLKIYETMIKTEQMDSILYMAQRQGKISFYMPSLGEFACTIASAAALKNEDYIFPQYREQGTLLWRGFSIQECTNQCFGNHKDLGKGRQMPVHYGSNKLNYVTVSSPLTTQVPQAAGAGYAFRIRNEDKIAVTFFGEGAASEGDFHAAMNFGATLNCQTLFICRNNHYAISTPMADQFKATTVAIRGRGYGMTTLRVDGNDALAVYQAVKESREYIVKNKEPVFIELVTYRVGDHSTSDHSVLYREEEELNSWIKVNNPILRLGKYLEKQYGRKYNGKEDEELRAKYREETIQSLKNSTIEQFPPLEELFNDVYDVRTPNLEEQYKEFQEHLNKYQDKYNLSKYKK